MGELSDLKVRKLNKPGRYTAGETLYLKVSPSGNKSWIQRLIINGRRHDLGLGRYPLVSLAEARGKAIDNRALARSGRRPHGGQARGEAYGVCAHLRRTGQGTHC